MAKHLRQKSSLAPKRPKSAYNLFVSEICKNNNLTQKLKIKFAAQKWKTLPDELKDKYIEWSKDDKIRYQNELRSYKKTNPDKRLYITFQKQKRGSSNPFGVFFREMMKSNEEDPRQAMRHSATMWRNISSDD